MNNYVIVILSYNLGVQCDCVFGFDMHLIEVDSSC